MNKQPEKCGFLDSWRNCVCSGKKEINCKGCVLAEKKEKKKKDIEIYFEKDKDQLLLKITGEKK